MNVNDSLQIQNIYHDNYLKLHQIHSSTNYNNYPNLKYNQIFGSSNYLKDIDTSNFEKLNLDNFYLEKLKNDKNYFKIIGNLFVKSETFKGSNYYFVDNNNIVVGNAIVKSFIKIEDNKFAISLEGYISAKHINNHNNFRLYSNYQSFDNQ